MAAYDYVIVGAGSAGCVLAARLTEDASVRVLLLEAGGPRLRKEAVIPAAFSKLFKSDCDWSYETEPQPHLGGRKLYWPRGKMLGGSNSMNAMVYVRGHRSNYDRWHQGGNEGWGWNDVLPYFKKSEHQERGASELHGTGGPLCVCDPRYVNPLSRAFVDATAELGLPQNDDFNGPRQEGFGFYQVTQKNGRRCSAYTAFLQPAMRRPNLTVETGAHATRVLCDKGRARGVAYVRDGQAAEALAEREVLLCGGTINSPQLLMLSGVGPADELRRLGIGVQLDLPGVGANLQDHLFLPVAYRCRQPISLAAAESLGQLFRFLVSGRGMLASNVAEAGGFTRTRPGLDAPDLQFHFGPVYYLDHGFTRPEGHGFTLGPTLIRPRSRGRIRLRSADPFTAPLIDPHYLEDQEDVRVLVEGVKLGRQILAAKAFDAYRGDEFVPGAGVRAERELEDYVRGTVETIYHPVGTCRMGTDADAVVDARLRVRGVEGLRVVDGSVMPEIVGGNTNAPIIMMAERAADIVRSRA